MSASILIVTPTYNEREDLPTFLAGVFEAKPTAHVLVVDDGSPDGTGALADSIAAEDDRVFVSHRAKKLGIGSAYLDAFRWGLARERSDERCSPAFRSLLGRI